jgi:Domain of unknown function (DUF4129)
VSRRPVVPLALAVTALLAVVAIAAHGHPLGEGAGQGNGLPVSFWDYAYTSLVIVGVPVLLALLLAAVLIRPEPAKRRSFRRRLLISMVVYALVVAFVVAARHHVHLHLHHLTLPPGLIGRPKLSQNKHPSAGAHTLQFQWDELAIVVGLLLVVVAAAVVATRRSRPVGRKLELAPEALAAALDESLDDLRSDPDLRRAIIAAYARMENAFAVAGLPRHAAETPLEYLERALLSLDTSAEAVRRLTGLFEWARFSQHEPEPSMRDDAVDALIAVRDELRASELTPA